MNISPNDPRIGTVDGSGILHNVVGYWGTGAAPSAAVPVASATIAAATGVNPVEIAYSLYGHTIPLSVFGVGRIGGEIIAGPWIENGLASFIISFGVPADPSGTRYIREIAFDSEVVWETGSTTAAAPGDGTFSTEAFTWRFCGGTLTQLADALETSHFGAEANAYRPQILLSFENLPLANTKFRKIPYVSAVIADSAGDDVNLGEAFERLAYSPWVGYTSAQFDTSGVTDGLVSGGLIFAEQTEFLQAIQQFGRFYRSWDILQTDKLRIVDRGASVTPDITLNKTRLIGKVQFDRQEPNSVPSVLELTTIDPDADYTLVPSRAQRPRAPVAVTTSVKTESAFLPAIMDASTRIALVNYTKYAEEQARKKGSVTAMAYGLQIEPGALAALAGLGNDFQDETVKIVETLHGKNNTVELIFEAILKCTVAVSTGDSHPLDLTGPTAAYSFSRNLVSTYSGDKYHDTAGVVDTLYDQSGNTRDLEQATGANRPNLVTSGPNSIACGDFDGSNDFLIGAVAISSLISNSAGFVIMSVMVDSVSFNNANVYQNAGMLDDDDLFMGLFVKNVGGAVPTFFSYNWDGNSDSPTGTPIALATPYVLTWRHEAGQLYLSVNGAAETSVASGNTSTMTGLLRIGSGSGGTPFNGKIFELATYSSIPTADQRAAMIHDFGVYVGADV